MKCPFCGHLETQVVETRLAEDGGFIRRRRQCGACEKRFTTYEKPEVNFPAIVKKDGRRIDYQRDKLRASLNLALRKRPVSTEQVDSAIERIEEFVIVDKYNETVFDAQAEHPERILLVEDPDIGWKGDFRGQKAEAGVYRYRLSLRYIDGEVYTFTGNVILIR